MILADAIADAGGWVTMTNDLGREQVVVGFELDHGDVDRMSRALQSAGLSVLDWQERGAGAPIAGSIAYIPISPDRAHDG